MAALTNRVLQLRAQGRDIINCGMGEPQFDTPSHIADAGVAAIRSGATRYTPVAGTDDLKAAIIEKFRRENDIKYRPEQILISAGAKQAIFNVILACVGSGDEVIIPAPYWASYPDMVRLAGGVPVTPYAGLSQCYKITAAQLKSAITLRTRLFILNTPNNPTGATYTRAELAALAEVLRAHRHVAICTDEIYEHIYWGAERFSSLASVCPDLCDRTVTTNGVSKAYAMTGWRLGYCGGPAELIAAMATIQSQSTSNASSIGQHAATAALGSDQACVRQMQAQYKGLHQLTVDRLNRLPGFACVEGTGTFYAFANVEGALKITGARDDQAFAEHVLEHAGVAVIPGSAFGAPGHIRLSYAQQLDALEEAFRRIMRVLSAHG